MRNFFKFVYSRNVATFPWGHTNSNLFSPLSFHTMHIYVTQGHVFKFIVFETNLLYPLSKKRKTLSPRYVAIICFTHDRRGELNAGVGG